MHARDDEGRMVEMTTSSMIAELHHDGRPPDAWIVLGSPCQREYTHVALDQAQDQAREQTGGQAMSVLAE